MKTSTKTLALWLIAILGVTISAQAAAPTVQSISVDSIQLGENTDLRTTVADADGDLAFVAFYASGPGISGWLHLGDRNVSGSSALANLIWQPPQAGAYTLLVEVHDTVGSASTQRTFEVYAGKLVIAPVTIANGVNRMHQYSGEIVTTENASSANIVVQNGGNFILWSGGRVTLKPGFRAEAGSQFWAAIDHNMNGYSDLEEATDTDGDGMFDAWEVDHGLNMLVNDAGGDLDQDGTTNLQEFLAGRNPNDRSDSAGLPASVQLVLRSPSGQYLGINTTTWKITPVANP
ncbi:MAG: hypothetical protein QM715_20170 [Nibricoccus sp.]